MNYRLLKFTTIYAGVKEQVLSLLPNPAQLSYRQLYEAVAGFRFAWSDYHIKHIRAFGNEAENVFSDFSPLQKAWAREHNVEWTEDGWLREIAVAQVREFQPDVIFIEDLYVFDADFRQQLRAACRGSVFIIGYRAAPIKDVESFRDMDLLLTCVPNFAARLAQSGASVGILRHAFEPAIIDAITPLPDRDLDFTFTGHLVLQNGYHQERRVLVQKLLELTPLEMWVQVSEPPGGAARLAAGLTKRTGRVLQKIAPTQVHEKFRHLSESLPEAESPYTRTLRRRFARRLHAPVFGLDNFRVLARSRVTFNNHIDVAESHAGNMRLFEATGMGACLLTDWKQDLHEIFDPDHEVVTYKSAEECVEKVKYLLSHEKECEAIAAAGQRRTLRDHTFQRRAAQLDETICALLAGGSRPLAAYSLPDKLYKSGD